jgi:hypothetical protein
MELAHFIKAKRFDQYVTAERMKLVDGGAHEVSKLVSVTKQKWVGSPAKATL